MKNIIMGMFILTSAICANPVTLVPGATPVELFALFSEALVVSFLLTKHHFNFIYLLLLWFVITFVTYIVFIWIGISFMISFFGDGWFFPSAIVFEIIIILVEARIIKKLSGYKNLIENINELTMKDAYKISIIGNLVSIAMGFIGIWAFDY